jgi:hypothetical protein
MVYGVWWLFLTLEISWDGRGGDGKGKEEGDVRSELHDEELELKLVVVDI